MFSSKHTTQQMVSALILFNYSVCVSPLKSCFCLMYLLPKVLTHKNMLVFWHIRASAYQNSWNCYSKWPGSNCTVCTVLSSVILHSASSCTTAKRTCSLSQLSLQTARLFRMILVLECLCWSYCLPRPSLSVSLRLMISMWKILILPELPVHSKGTVTNIP